MHLLPAFLILLGGPCDRYFCRLNLDPSQRKHFADLLHAQKLHIHGVKPIWREVVVEWAGDGSND